VRTVQGPLGIMRAPLERAFPAITTALAVSLAAPLAHAAIDLLGDYVLPHDPMDALAHRSRALVAATGLAVALAFVLRLVWSALQEARGSGGGRAALERLLAEPAWRAVARTALFAFVGLAAMEAFDTLSAGAEIDDAGDLVGGSFPLAGAVDLVVSAAVALGLRRGLRLALATHRTLVGVLLVFFVTASAASAAWTARRRPETQRRRRAITQPLRVRGLRAPPLLAAA
jgi:hypothetical protein